jgi:hypothetical protein
VLDIAGLDLDQDDLTEEQEAQRAELNEQLNDLVIIDLPVNRAMQELCAKATELKQ